MKRLVLVAAVVSIMTIGIIIFLFYTPQIYTPQIEKTKELPLFIKFESSCKNTPIAFTGNLWLYLNNSPINYSLRNKDAEGRISWINNSLNVTWLRLIAEVKELEDIINYTAGASLHGNVGRKYTHTALFRLSANKSYPARNLTFDYYTDIYQDVGDISEMRLDLGYQNYSRICVDKIKLTKAIDRDLFKPLILCPEGYSVVGIEDNALHLFGRVTLYLESGKKYDILAGEEAGTEYELLKKDNKFIILVRDWGIWPACGKDIFGRDIASCEEEYSLEIDPEMKTCIKK